MSSFNKVILMGNLTRDPEIRYTQGGMAICSIGLAVNERFKGQDGEWQDRASFIDITIFGKRGEAFAKFHKKGAPAFIEGKLRLDQWEDKQSGQKRSKLFVVADSWEFVGGAQGQGGQGGGGGGGQGGWSQPAPAPDSGGGSGGGSDPWSSPAPAGGGGGGGAPGPGSFDETPF
jgi:single-strand DNA-binding protein